MNLVLNSHVRCKLARGRPEPGLWPRTQILWDKPYGESSALHRPVYHLKRQRKKLTGKTVSTCKSRNWKIRSRNCLVRLATKHLSTLVGGDIDRSIKSNGFQLTDQWQQPKLTTTKKWERLRMHACISPSCFSSGKAVETRGNMSSQMRLPHQVVLSSAQQQGIARLELLSLCVLLSEKHFACHKRFHNFCFMI